MSASIAGEHTSPSISLESSIPRRALRKGTRSCAECKRRKTRCFFEHSSAAICLGCQRRGTPCIGQEFVDVPIPGAGPSGDSRGAESLTPVMESLKRVEHVLEDLNDKIFTLSLGSQPRSHGGESVMLGDSGEDRLQTDRDGGHVSSMNTTTSTTEDTPGSSVIITRSNIGVSVTSPEGLSEPDGSLHFILPRCADTCRALHAAFPSQKDTNTLFIAGRATIFLQALCNPYNELFSENSTTESATMFVLPPVTSHPVILARKLLQLALCIQQLDPTFDRSSLEMGLSPSEAGEEYFNLASHTVTCHEEFLDSLEGLECLIYEGVYLVNCGSLRRALVCLRRASTLAQFMGFHRKGLHKAVYQHDPSTRVSGYFTWTHIAYLERYISLLLGLPTSITRVQFASAEKPAVQTHTEWLEKVQIDICDHIIDRNQRGDYDLEATQFIDNTLNKAANSIPAKWWAPMEVRQGMCPNEVMSRVITAQLQIVHYNLLTVLHLPYLLRNPGGSQIDYSKTTCLYASREVLNRFITFRSIVRIVFCCRIVDFCAFTAAMTLLVAHLCQQGGNSSPWLLTHQRLGDRALIVRTIETLEELHRQNHDELSLETAKLARKLLDLEEESADVGDTYNCVLAEHQNESREGHASRSLYLRIPYFGTIRLMPDVSLPAPTSHTAFAGSFHSDNPVGPPGPDFSTASSSLPSDVFKESNSIEEQVAAQASGQGLQLMQGTDIAVTMDQTFAHLDGGFGSFDPYDVAMPDIMASADDWAFQGVDTAFFDSLINGRTTDQGGRDEGWTGMN